MKRLILLLMLMLIASNAFGSAQIIICGWQPGEIYFVGVHSAYWGYAGFFTTAPTTAKTSNCAIP